MNSPEISIAELDHDEIHNFSHLRFVAEGLVSRIRSLELHCATANDKIRQLESEIKDAQNYLLENGGFQKPSLRDGIADLHICLRDAAQSYIDQNQELIEQMASQSKAIASLRFQRARALSTISRHDTDAAIALEQEFENEALDLCDSASSRLCVEPSVPSVNSCSKSDPDEAIQPDAPEQDGLVGDEVTSRPLAAQDH